MAHELTVQRERAQLLRRLPSVDELLRRPELEAITTRQGRLQLVNAARAFVENLRAEILAGRIEPGELERSLETAPAAIEASVRQMAAYSLRPVINATGVILHTNLGRAPLSNGALEHVREVAGVYSNLEYELESGRRGKRDVHTQKLFARLLGDEVATVVVNNNAAAVLLALNTLAEGGEVIVSRGELVEIGGSFRIPEIMAKSGAVLREVGTTNRTRISDYEKAMSERTRLLLRVHRSNFQIVGFTEQPPLAELAALGRQRGIPVMEDLGSGALCDLRLVGIAGEPSVSASLRAGIDVVTYSGDKLLGGPQAGMLSGRRELIGRIRANPLFRALRVDKLTYASLEATLLAYLREDYDSIPALRLLRMPLEQLERRAHEMNAAISVAGLDAEALDGESVPGGGSAPGATLPTKLLAIAVAGLTAEELAAKLRTGDPPVIARVEEGRVLLDLRTVFPEQDADLERALRRAASG